MIYNTKENLKFYGKYEVTLDGKNRFLLPKGLREKLPENQKKDFVISRSFDNEKCLSFFTEAEFEAAYEEDLLLDDKDPEVAKFFRLIYGDAMTLSVDTSDRITLPKSYMEFAGITKDIVMITGRKKLEIWDVATYEAYKNSHITSLPDLSKKMSTGNYNKVTTSPTPSSK